MNENICQFKGCKKIATYQTGFENGNYCHHHYKLLKHKNPKLKGFKIYRKKEELELIKRFKRMPNIRVGKELVSYSKRKKYSQEEQKNT